MLDFSRPKVKMQPRFGGSEFYRVWVWDDVVSDWWDSGVTYWEADSNMLIQWKISKARRRFSMFKRSKVEF